MLALAIAFEIQCRFTAAVLVMAKGFNHAIQLAISTAAGTGRLFWIVGRTQIAHAISIATVDNISLACVHVEPVSQWKGFSPGLRQACARFIRIARESRLHRTIGVVREARTGCRGCLTRGSMSIGPTIPGNHQADCPEEVLFTNPWSTRDWKPFSSSNATTA